MKLEDIKLILFLFITGVFIWFGLVTLEYIQVLKNCEAFALETFNPEKACPLLCTSSPNTPSGTAHEVPQDIVIQAPWENITNIMDCLENQFNLSEWERCNRIVRRPPV